MSGADTRRAVMRRVPTRALVSLGVVAAVLCACRRPPTEILAGAGADEDGGDPSGDTSMASAQGETTIHLADRHQRIAGFGAASNASLGNINGAQADLLFSPEIGAGLSLFALDGNYDGTVAPSSTTSAQARAALLAQNRGAAVWLDMPTPPPPWKSTGLATGTDPESGQCCVQTRLLPEHYSAWAQRLVSLINNALAFGITPYALSAQLSPDWTGLTPSCWWDTADLLTFLRDYLVPAIAASGRQVRIIAPHTRTWGDFRPYAQPLLDDSALLPHLSIMATSHRGGQDWFRYAEALELGKEVWQTGTTIPGSVDAGMATAIPLAVQIHLNLVLHDVSAWHYAAFVSENGNEGLTMADFRPTKRLWSLANFSKFVRPGFVRLGVDGGSAAGVYVSAYLEESSGKLAAVAINATDINVTQQFHFDGFTIGAVTPWVTSASQDLEEQQVTPAGSSFSYQLPAQTVVTFVGTVASE